MYVLLWFVIGWGTCLYLMHFCNDGKMVTVEDLICGLFIGLMGPIVTVAVIIMAVWELLISVEWERWRKTTLWKSKEKTK